MGIKMDYDGYPTEAELRKIRKWPYTDFVGLMEFIRSNCWWPNGDSGWKQRGRRYRLATGGWSGNESVIGALSRNPMFDALCWQSSHRGGLHIYHIPRIAK